MTSQFKVTVHKDGMQWGEYVTAGETYTVTPPANKRNRTKGDYHFRNERTGGGTFMRWYQFDRAMAAGWMTAAAEQVAA